MKKSHLLLTMLTAFLAVCLPAAACTTAVEYSLNTTQADLTVGETTQLTVTSSSTAEFSVTYSSDNETVATVTEAGLVTAVAEGTATVTAEVDGKELTCSVTVSAVSYSYSLNETSATLEEEETLQLSVTSTPVKELSVAWTTSDDAVATVNQSGLVTAVAEGTATVTATVDGQKLNCAITVEKPPVLYSYVLNHNKADVEVGETLGLTLTVTPEIPDMQLSWKSSDSAIASVTEEGVVTAHKKGKATISAVIDGTAVAACEVNAFVYEYVYEHALTVNYGDDKAALPVTITPARPIDISYEVEGTAITIDENGAITTVGVGTATVTIKDGETEIGTCVVTVVPVITVEEEVQLHVGDTHIISVETSPEDPDLVVTYEITEGDAVTLGADSKTLTAAKNGVATVKVTAGEKEVYCKVVVDGVNATVTNTDLQQSDVEQLSGSGVEYWENYISNEVNHKAIGSEEEDIINREFLIGNVNYFPDFAKLVWTDGGDCAKPSKPDGWSEGATLTIRNVGDNEVKAQLTVRVYAGQSTIKLYTGVFKGTSTVTLYHGETAITSYVIKDEQLMTRNLLTFNLDVEEATDIRIVLALTDTTADNSFLSLVAASVSGDTYSLEKNGARVAPSGTAQITVNANGTAVNTGVTYESENTDIATVDSNGLVTGVALGDTRIKVTVDGRVRYFVVEVGYAYSLDTTEVLLHKSETQQISVVSDPVGADVSGAQFSSDNDGVATVSANGTITAVENGTANITVTVDGKTLTCVVKVNDVVAGASVEKLAKDRNNPVDITAGAEYWEQYIANGEINHKQYKNVEEDIISRTCDVTGNYLSDYAAFLSWHGGATGATCSCGQCNKDSQNGGDGGWTNDGTKAYAVNQKDQVITLTIKVFAGNSTIKVYTGGYNLKGQVTMKADGTVLAQETFDNQGAHNSQCVTFNVSAVEDTEVTIELVMIDDYNNAPHSCISLAAVSVSGSVYQLNNTSARIVPNDTAEIELLKDGVKTNAQYESENTAIATVNANGVVTGVTAGETRIKVTADGRVRYFTVNVGYNYSLAETSATVKVGATYQIQVVSDPAGSTETVIYQSLDTGVATVSTSGLVTGVAQGNTEIKVTVDGNDLTVSISVASYDVVTEAENIDGKFIDLTQSNVLYYEHYIWNELATKKLADGEKDLIDIGNIPSDGNDNYGAYMYFADAEGAKATAGNDKAYKKYCKISHDHEFNVTVPAGTHEIRVYAGAYAATLTTSLLDGDQVIGSYVLDSSARTTYLIKFTVTTEEETTFKVALGLDGGDGSCIRLAAVSIATPDEVKAATTTVTATSTETDGDTVTQVNLSEKGNLDWIYYNTEFGGGNNGNIAKKSDGNYINDEKISTWNEWDYRAGITWNDGDGNFNAADHPDGDTSRIGDGHHNNFVADEQRLLATVKVDANVNTITIYASGYQSVYNVFVYDSNGNLLIDQVVVSEAGGGSKACEITLTVTATQAETLRVGVYKVNGNNIGLSAIAVSGTQA